MVTVLIKGYWIICPEDEDLNEEFGAGQFDDAYTYLNEQRKVWPDKKIEMIAEIDA